VRIRRIQAQSDPKVATGTLFAPFTLAPRTGPSPRSGVNREARAGRPDQVRLPRGWMGNPCPEDG